MRFLELGALGATLLTLLGGGGCFEATSYTPLPPTVPQLRLPRNDAYQGSVVTRSLRPRFVWESSIASKGTIRYELQYARDNAFLLDVVTIESYDLFYQPDMDLSVSTIPPVGDVYYWRVRACTEQCSEYSKPWRINLGRSDKDFNGDGYDDVIVGAPNNDDNGIRDAGKVYVYFGGAGSTFDPDPNGTMTNSTADERFGSSVASAGDFNGDGFADIVVGAKFSSERALLGGRAYLYFGGAGDRFDGVADATLSDASARDNFGFSVSSAGDINGDGYSDVVVGAPGNDAAGSDAGRAYVYLGGPKPPFDAAVLVFSGEAAEDSFGTAVNTAGDFNGDGYADVVVAAQRARQSSTVDCRAYLFLGSSTTELDSTADAVLGEGSATACTQRLGAAGDFNSDGFSDLVFGTQDALGATVSLYVGGRSLPLLSPTLRNPSGAIQSASAVGDLNGDGSSDLAVGSGDAPPFRVEIYLGSGIGIPDLVAKTPVATFLGSSANDGYAGAVSRAGDVNGDGFGDLVVGAANDGSSGLQAGRAFVYLGNAGGSIDVRPDGILDPRATESFFGSSVAGSDTSPHRRSWITRAELRGERPRR